MKWILAYRYWSNYNLSDTHDGEYAIIVEGTDSFISTYCQKELKNNVKEKGSIRKMSYDVAQWLPAGSIQYIYHWEETLKPPKPMKTINLPTGQIAQVNTPKNVVKKLVPWPVPGWTPSEVVQDTEF